jgi:phytoene dehydrogenase-like protein
MLKPDPEFDVLIIGAGIAGLISACRLGQAGKKVLLVEKLSFLGGRFSAFPYNGAEISSGAFHTFPHGSGGRMAKALQRAGIDLKISKPTVIASFHLGDRNIVSKSVLDFFKVLQTLPEKLTLVRLFSQVALQKHYPGSFGDWMVRIGASTLLVTVFDRFCQFALSTSVFSVPYSEGRKIVKHVVLYGLPGVPRGGARAVVQQLRHAATVAGVTIWKTTQVVHLDLDPETGKIASVCLQDRRKNQQFHIRANHIISTIGPQASHDLLKRSGMDLPEIWPLSEIPPAIGLKIHVLSPKSLIDHDSIMFCLNTRRIAGILQATNADPSLAPQGKHLLISHQMVAPGSNWQEEKALALADWQDIFKQDFVECEVIGTSQFPESFPVNWAVQGRDLRSQPFVEIGFWLAGDGVKPPGLMMVEGVAASAEEVAEQVLAKSSPN